MYRPTTRTSEKCVGCYPADRGQGRDAQPERRARARRAACRPASARFACRAWSRSATTAPGRRIPTNPLYFLIRERQVALPLYPQFGTEPNGFYIPPRWVSRGYLTQMFGPGVEHAIEQYSCPDRELLAVLQLFRAQRQILFRFEIEKGPKVAEIPVLLPSGKEKVQEIFNDTVIGFNKFGKEVVRITIEEPTFERPEGPPPELDLT